MRSVNRLPIEEYHCSDCEEQFHASDVENTWKCPLCNELIQIFAEHTASGTAITLQRLKAEELELYDMIHLPGQLTKDSYRILRITPQGGQLSFALEGYGSYAFHPQDPVNQRTGAWYK